MTDRRRKIAIVVVSALVVLAWTIAALGQPTTAPAVYRQPADSAPKWATRGVRTAICYEPSGGTVSIKAWEAAWVAQGCKVIREPSGDYKADDADANLAALLHPMQEPDNEVVHQQDANAGNPQKQAAAIEAVYVGLEAGYRTMKTGAPHKPVVLILGLEQFRWSKVDTVRLLKSCDYCAVDEYVVHRNMTPADLAALLDKFRAVAGNKLRYVFIECSNQRLSVDAYPNQRAPTPDELAQELDLVTARGLGSIAFPQQIGESGGGFQYDAMPANLEAVWSNWARPKQSPPPPVGPLHLHTLTIDGFSYTLTTK